MRGAPIGPGSWVDPDGTVHHEGAELRVSVSGPHEVVQRYLAGTLIVQTVFVTPAGATGVADLVWEGRLYRVVRPYTGAAGVEVEGAVEDDGVRDRALEHWWSRVGDPAAPHAELRARSRALASLLGGEPGDLRDPEEVDAMGLWRRADGSVDAGSHAAFGAVPDSR